MSGISWSCGSSRWLYTPAVRSSRGHPRDARQLSAWPRTSPLLSQEVLQGRVVQHGVGQQPFQPRVLVLQRLQPLGLRDLHPTELGFPFVDAGVANAMLAAQIGDRYAGLMLLQNPDDLFFRKSAALHALVLVVGQSELQTGLSPWGKVTVASAARSPYFLFGLVVAERNTEL
nr:insertion element ISR1 hypothetical 30.8 kDa protein A [Bradyrhizobium sp. DOA9]